MGKKPTTMNEADLNLVESCIGETRLSFSLRLAWKVIGEKDDEIERLRGESRRLTTFVAMIAEQNCLEDAANGCDCFACLVRHDAERVLAHGPGGDDE